jgi:hypothetical protein
MAALPDSVPHLLASKLRFTGFPELEGNLEGSAANPLLTGGREKGQRPHYWSEGSRAKATCSEHLGYFGIFAFVRMDL